MEFTINTVGFVFIILGCIIAGLVLGFFISKKVFTAQLKKNPPINEDMIKAMYRSMGVTPSQARVNQTMKAINDASKK
jgi:uncharacterized protein